MHARCFCSFLCFGINSRFLPFSLNRWCPFSLFPIENRVFGICGRHAIILVPSSTWHTPSASIIRTTEPRYVQLDTQLNILLPVGIKNHINVSNCLSYSKVVSLAKHSISCYQVLSPWSLKNPESCVTRICPPGIALAPVVISRSDLDNSDSVWHTGYLYHLGPAQRL